MAKKKTPKSIKKKTNILDQITADDAIAILKILAQEDKRVGERIEQIAMEYLSGVDIEDIASQVYFDLDNIEVEEVWERSGSTRDGYVEPVEVAWQLFEEALESFLEKLKRYQELSMHAEAKNYCMGILKGIYQFEKESKSEYKDWAADAPREYFEMVLNDWKKGCENPKNVESMNEFVKKNFPGW